MAHSPQGKHLMPTKVHDTQRSPRGHTANASSTRSKSASGSFLNETYGESSAGPSSTRRSVDANSQHTTDLGKNMVQMRISHDSDPDHRNNRTDSDRTNNSGNSQRPDLGDWDERKMKGHRTNLTVLDVAALILNKQIGTGIFTTPGAVLLSTQSKGLSVALWTIGGFWTLMFLLIYLEFGEALPYNGGELVYLDEIFNTPELLATILFSGYFLMLANSYGNSIQFAKHVLIAAFPDLQDSTELDSRLIRYIAISAITLVCLIHWHSSRAGLFLNKLVAWYKVLLLVVVFVAGMVWSGKNKSEWSSTGNGSSTSDGMTGMVLIFYSYQGWENANYVAGEIRTKDRKFNKRTLEFGAILGVTTTWVLYVLVTIAIYRVLDYNDLTNVHSDLAVALRFAPKVFGAATGLKVCMAISALGNIIAVTYTASKVKQSIAVQRILPFWRYLQADHETPKGALVLHWITSVIFVSCAPSSSDGYSFAVGIYTYGHIIFSVFVALGLFRLEKRVKRLRFFSRKIFLYSVPFAFALGNILILVFAGKTHKEGKIPRWWWPIVISIVLFVSGLYWAGIQLFMSRTVGALTGLRIRIERKDQDYVPALRDPDDALAARVDGSGRRVIVETSGRLESWSQDLKSLGTAIGGYLF